MRREWMMTDSTLELTQDGMDARVTVTTGDRVTVFRLDGTGQAAAEQIALLHGEIARRNGQLVALAEKWARRAGQVRGEWYSDVTSIDKFVEDVEDILKMGGGMMLIPRMDECVYVQLDKALAEVERLKDALAQIASAKPQWTANVGSYAGGETWAGFAHRLQQFAAEKGGRDA